jgi:hypothetical protein
MNQRDDLSLVRDRIEFARQATVLFGRLNIIACTWDELTPDTPLARLLRCATELLLNRVRLPVAAADLRDALAILEEVEPVHPLEAPECPVPSCMSRCVSAHCYGQLATQRHPGKASRLMLLHPRTDAESLEEW